MGVLIFLVMLNFSIIFLIHHFYHLFQLHLQLLSRQNFFLFHFEYCFKVENKWLVLFSSLYHLILLFLLLLILW